MATAADKYAGAVVGLRKAFDKNGQDVSSSAADIANGASVEEVLVGHSGVLTAALDPTTGEVRWRQAADTERAQTAVVCRTQMSSMLKDSTRNAAYAEAIRRCLCDRSAATVLDIGAGTGLLSLLAARAGASHVYGIEQWSTMADIARQVVQANAPGAVTILNAHSTSVTVGTVAAAAAVARTEETATAKGRQQGNSDERQAPDSHAEELRMPAKADVVVSEILDSALLGEGVILALRDAYSRLVHTPQKGEGEGEREGGAGSGNGSGSAAESDSASNTAVHTPPCVPVRATVFAQLVHSQAAGCWQDTSSAVLRSSSSSQGTPASGPGKGIGMAPASNFTMALRPGCQALHPAIPVHALRLMEAGDLIPLTEPFAALDIDFSPNSPFFAHPPAGQESAASTIVEKVHKVQALQQPSNDSSRPSTANAVLFWWDLVLAEASHHGPAVVYSTSPTAAATQGWQDHWVQCMQPLPTPLPVPAPSTASPAPAAFTVVACHNDSRIWFYTGTGEARTWTSKRAHKLAEKKAKAELQALKDASGVADAEIQHAQAAMDAIAGIAVLYTEPQPCTCGLHATVSLDRRWAFAQHDRMQMHARAVDAALAMAIATKQQEAAELQAAAAAAGIDLPCPPSLPLSEDGDTGHAHSVQLAVMDVSDGGLAAALALSLPATHAGQAAVTVFVPHSVPTTDGVSPARPAQTDAMEEGEGEGEGEGEEQDGEGDANGADNAGQTEAPVDPTRVHLENLVASAQSSGVLAPCTRLVLVPAPPHACTPRVLGSVLATAIAEEEEEEEEEEDDDDESMGEEEEEQRTITPVHLDAVLGEPFFHHTATAPLVACSAWWYRVHALVAAGACGPHAVLTPSAARIMVQAVCFTHLHDSFSPLGGPVCGLEHSALDALQREANGYDTQSKRNGYDFNLPLWQYQYSPCSAAQAVLDIDFRQPPPRPGQAWPAPSGMGMGALASVSSGQTNQGEGDGDGEVRCTGSLSVQCKAGTNAVLFWVEYDMQPRPLFSAQAGHSLPQPSSSFAPLVAFSDVSLILSQGPAGGDANMPGPYRQTVRFLPAPTADSCLLTMGVGLDEDTGMLQTVVARG